MITVPLRLNNRRYAWNNRPPGSYNVAVRFALYATRQKNASRKIRQKMADGPVSFTNTIVFHESVLMLFPASPVHRYLRHDLRRLQWIIEIAFLTIGC